MPITNLTAYDDEEIGVLRVYNAALVLGNLGKIHLAMKQFEKSLEVQQYCLALLRKYGTPHDVAEALGNLGNVHRVIGDSNRAAECYKQALSIFDSDGDSRHRAQVLLNLADLYDPGKGITYNEALQLSRKSGDAHSEGLALLKLGMAHRRLGDGKARDYISQAATILDDLSAPEAVDAKAILNDAS